MRDDIKITITKPLARDSLLAICVLGVAVVGWFVGIPSIWRSETGRVPCNERPGLAGDLVRSLAASPDQWTATQFNLRHTPSGLEFWIANGPSNMKPEATYNSDDWENPSSLYATEAQTCAFEAYQNWRRHRQYEPSIRSEGS